ncbi:MAG: hypothetical protein IJO74_02295 [Clostridia bacterium]|nr:hypothetical protein [Clostridia bacterium]
MCFAIYGIKKPAVLEPSSIIVCPSQISEDAFYGDIPCTRKLTPDEILGQNESEK